MRLLARKAFANLSGAQNHDVAGVRHASLCFPTPESQPESACPSRAAASEQLREIARVSVEDPRENTRSMEQHEVLNPAAETCGPRATNGARLAPKEHAPTAMESLSPFAWGL